MHDNLISVPVFLSDLFENCSISIFSKFILFQNPTKMAGRLTLQERAQIAARYEVWGCIVQVQRWLRIIKGNYILKTNYSFLKDQDVLKI